MAPGENDNPAPAADSDKDAPPEAGGDGQMSRRKRMSATNATVYVVLTVAAVVLVNLIATRAFTRLDLTQNGVYTLARGSKDIARNLPDFLTVKLYISSELPPQLNPVSRYLRDLIDEYRSSSKGKLRFEALDPDKDKKIEEEAGQCKIQRIPIQVTSAQKFSMGGYWLGLCFQYQGKTESIARAVQPEGLEWAISSIIKRMTQKKRKVAFTTGHGELDPSNGFQGVKHFLDQEFETSSVNPSNSPIPDDVDTLVVGGPKQPFDDKGRREIDAFLMKGRGAVFLVDGMAMQAPRGGMPPEMMGAQPKIGQPNDAGLAELLEKYGFKIGQDFVLDKQAYHGPVDTPDGGKMLATKEYYVGVKIKGGDDVPPLLGVNAIIFPFPSSVELVGPLAGGKPQAGKLWTLATSSPASWKHTGMFFLSPTAKIEEGKEKGSSGLAFAYEGPLKSAYPSPGAPPGMSAPDVPGAPPSESRKPVRMIVVGDSDFASDEYFRLADYPILALYRGGLQMLVNSVSWMLEDEALTPVRTKTMTSRPIQVESEAAVPVIKALNIAGVPLAFIGFGVVRWRLRRANRAGQKL